MIYFFLVIYALAGCAAQTALTGSNKQTRPQTPDNSAIGGSDSGDTDSGSDIGNDELFASKDKSLDAYFLIDVSLSLEEKDRPCLRFEALVKFRQNIAKIMGNNGDLRASLITFSDRARFEFTDTDFLQKSEQDFYEKYRRVICRHEGYTNTKEGFDLTVSIARDLMGRLGPKQQVSLLFFTDGEPRVEKTSPYAFNQKQLYNSAKELQKVFPNRIFSLLLGNGQTEPNRNNVLESVTPLDFLSFLSNIPIHFAQAQINSDVEVAINRFLGI